MSNFLSAYGLMEQRESLQNLENDYGLLMHDLANLGLEENPSLVYQPQLAAQPLRASSPQSPTRPTPVPTPSEIAIARAEIALSRSFTGPSLPLPVAYSPHSAPHNPAPVEQLIHHIQEQQQMIKEHRHIFKGLVNAAATVVKEGQIRKNYLPDFSTPPEMLALLPNHRNAEPSGKSGSLPNDNYYYY